MLSENQAPVLEADVHFGEPGTSSIKYESDVCLRKKGSDVVLIGHAYSRKGPVKILDVSLQVGSLQKTVRVSGDRKWHRSFGSWRITDPIPFDSMPLIYERAFGGLDDAHPDSSKHGSERRNPVGTGFAVSGKKEILNEMPLPNIEGPKSQIKSWKDKPAPCGFGFVGRDWAPRVDYAGTYDEQWEKERCPLLPTDFDELYYNGAHPDLVSTEFLKGNEMVKITNASKRGNLVFKLPQERLEVDILIQGVIGSHPAVMDTVIIEPDENRLMAVWRATIPTYRKFLLVDAVRIRNNRA